MPSDRLGAAFEQYKEAYCFLRGFGGGYRIDGKPVKYVKSSDLPSCVEPEIWRAYSDDQRKEEAK